MSQDREVLNSLDMATYGALLKIDHEATAAAGIIILNVDEAIAEARQRFLENVTRSEVRSEELEIEVVNNAPVTKVVNGEATFFAANGIIISYGFYHQVAEVDDR